MRLVVRASVDHGSVGRRHLNHGAVIVLAEGVGGQIRGFHIFRRVDQAGRVCLSRQVDACLLSKAENALVLGENIHALHPGNIHHNYVAGLHQSLHHGSRTVAHDSGNAVDIVASDRQKTVALERLAAVDNILLHGSCYRKGLLGRTWLVRIVDAEITPHLVPCLRFGLIVHGVNLFLAVVAAQIVRVVQIVPGAGIHGQDLSCLRIHDNSRRHVASDASLPLVNVFFTYFLNIQINCGNNRISILGRFNHALQVGIRCQVAVLSAVISHQGAVIILLDSSGTGASVLLGETDDIAGSGSVGIHSPVLVLKPDAQNFFLLAVLRKGLVSGLGLGLKLFLFLKGHLFFIPDIGAVLLSRDRAPQILRVKAEQLCEQRNGRLHALLFLILVHLLRIENQSVHLLAGGQVGSVPIHNVSPPVGNRPAVVILVG